MRALLADYTPWVISLVVIVMTILQGRKDSRAWVIAMAGQVLWFIWIWASSSWGLLPSTLVLCVLYARNYTEWLQLEEQAETDASVGLGWIIGNATGDKFRCWGDYGPQWTPDHNKALHFVRRCDAEEFCAEDEEAWRIVRVAVWLRPAEVEMRRTHKPVMYPPDWFLGQKYKTADKAPGSIEPSQPWPRC